MADDESAELMTLTAPTPVITHTTLCARPGCKGRDPLQHRRPHPAGYRCDGCAPAPATLGSNLCAPCRELFPATLRRLSSLWVDLHHHSGTIKTADLTTKVQTSGYQDISDRWRPDVIGELDELTDWAAYLGRVIAETPTATHYPRHWPTNPRLALALAATPEASRLLMHHPQVGPSLIADAISHEKAAHRALSSDPVRRFPLPVTCTHQVTTISDLGEEAVVPCGAPLTASIREQSSGRESWIFCTVHPTLHRYSRGEWLGWADQMDLTDLTQQVRDA